MSYMLRTSAVLGGCLVSSYWVRNFVSLGKPGIQRFLISIPVILFYFAAPLAFYSSEVVGRTAYSFLLTWLALFKVLAFCINRGPLPGSWTYAQFALIQNAPVIPQQATAGHKTGRLQDSIGNSSSVFLRYIGKLGLLGVVVFILLKLQPPMIPRHLLYAFGMYSFVGVMMDGIASVADSVLGLHLIPTFDSPWLSTSLQDFWSRRWNVPTSSCLRMTIYDPIMEGRLIAPEPNEPPPPTRPRPTMATRVLATTAVFAVSGVVHEVILRYAGSYPAGLEWFAFFTLQAPLCVLEAVLARQASAAEVKVPWLVRWALTMTTLMSTGVCLFFLPVERSGLSYKVVDSISASYAAAFDVARSVLVR